MAGLTFKGVLTLEDGTDVQVLVDDEDVSVAWGAEPPALGRTVDIRDALQAALREEVRRA
ncbi:hypothetical protein QDA02_gp63 [Microbacterium phage Margaery]|uniref:Uncharacterized protein n=1 Tax=Microbacterium phage Margaery TaxID=2591217 RepID=A0A514DHL3_9CAUD|nr:hypothetical protein QDA02_gp63 [Microbacterium phage Margaery]QDH93102.1 hypothetical protein PBI_MARGAERY_45 [Microbacterium phage Margaery]